MNPWLALIIGLAVGGFVTSLVEYLKNYNLVDLILDLFRSEAQKAEALAKKGEAILVNSAGKVKKLV
jgi:hypothetical protein